jgi:hypothetical protein
MATKTQQQPQFCFPAWRQQQQKTNNNNHWLSPKPTTNKIIFLSPAWLPRPVQSFPLLWSEQPLTRPSVCRALAPGLLDSGARFQANRLILITLALLSSHPTPVFPQMLTNKVCDRRSIHPWGCASASKQTIPNGTRPSQPQTHLHFHFSLHLGDPFS